MLREKERAKSQKRTKNQKTNKKTAKNTKIMSDVYDAGISLIQSLPVSISFTGLRQRSPDNQPGRLSSINN